MAVTNTIKFLPSIFQTATNEKFLNATLDQLTTEADLRKVNGYIGRKFAPTYKPTDNYIAEPSKLRQNYQLEPTVVVQDKQAGTVSLQSNYIDLIQQIGVLGGNTKDHSRLFANESYTFDGLFDFDKFSNYQNYYWLPDGMQAAAVGVSSVSLEETFSVSRNLAAGGYTFGTTGTNPVITLVRGGTYKFNISQSGNPFWIQTEPGTSGTRALQSSIGTREINGVSANGASVGQIVFHVPPRDLQDPYSKMLQLGSVDFATSLSYNTIQHSLLSVLLDNHPDVFDGIVGDINRKTFIFVGQDQDATFWETPGVLDKFDEFYDSTNFDAGQVIATADRYGMWRLELHPVEGNDYIISLVPIQQAQNNQRVYVKGGFTHATREFYLGINKIFNLVPINTSAQDVLYYQDGTDPSLVGLIQLVDPANFQLDVDNDIIGRMAYTAPNGVVFTNGLKVKFDSSVTPSTYHATQYADYVDWYLTVVRNGATVTAIPGTSPVRYQAVAGVNVIGDFDGVYGYIYTNEYYVEGVGTGIRLVSAISLVTPEPYVVAAGGLTAPDYITINRDSVDSNPWSRSNRWFHIDAITAAATYNNTVATPDQALRAQRPIIEFEGHLQLFNTCRVAKDPVDHLHFINVGDTVITKITNTDGSVTTGGGIISDKRSNRWIIGGIAYTTDQVFTDAKNQIEGAATYGNDLVMAFGIAKSAAPVTMSGIMYGGAGNYYMSVDNTTGITPGMYVVAKNVTLGTKVVSIGITLNNIVYPNIIQLDTANTGVVSDTHAQFGNNILQNDMRVIFGNDVDPAVRNTVYKVKIIDTTGATVPYGNGGIDRVIHLIEDTDGTVETYNGIIVTSGTNAGISYWFDGTNWMPSQTKSSVNQPPLFDVFDENGVSLGDASKYLVTTFEGTPIFSYKQGTGSNDKVLGFPLSYRNFNSIGDIQFTNNFDADTFSYSLLLQTLVTPINYNFIHQTVDLNTAINRNIWTKNKEETKQYQIFSFEYSDSNYFPVDVLPAAETVIPYTKVFVNNQILKTSDYEYYTVKSRQTVRVNVAKLAVGDKVDILIYSKTPSATGYYEIPNNLDFNSANAVFDTLTLGQLRNHVKTIEQNTRLAVDAGANFRGLRDIEYKSNGGSIVQQSAPAMYSNLFLTDKNVNFMNGLDLASREYLRFKNKFLELGTKLSNGANSNDVANSVDSILKTINGIKNKSFPWYYSDMVAYGDNKNVITYSIINPLQSQYEITQIFNDTALSNQSVLVYLNGLQLINGTEFRFPQDRTAITLDLTRVTLTAGDVLKIVEYHDTDGSFIPETPSKLGLYPKFIPSRFVDDSYITPVEVIQGHDGSITPVFNDIRDDLLLELEKRIYNNIKIDYETHVLDLYDYLPGKFRSTEYTNKEFTQILSSRFLRWVGDNRVDYSTNSYFDSNNAWTWNYKKFKDRVDGEQLTGTWRSIFSYFFDTYRPHTHPWEMLGFGQKPTWWEDRYGVAPYTGSNLLLWQDLEAGYIHAGSRAGIDTRFARPGLTKVVPVDDYGSLLSPDVWAALQFDSLKANASYSVGDQGPVEFAWRSSSSYPFAVQHALALAKPGFYFGSLSNIARYFRNTAVDQFTDTVTNQRITPRTILINGDTSSGTTVRTAGYINWVRDYVLSLGIDPVELIQTYLNKVEIQLSYKMAGYTDKKFIEVLAEQGSPTNTNNSIIVPTENYSVNALAGTPIRKITYSAVVVEKSGNGYTVNGYDQNNPYFTIIPSNNNNNFYTISAANSRALIYRDYQPMKLTVPYGFEFTNPQQLVDFLVSYGRYLTSQGFTFDSQDAELSTQRDWVLSAKEFLTWSQQGWAPGNIIVLSPTYNVLTNIQADGIVAEVENSPSGTKVLDQNGNFIRNTQFTEQRNGNKFSLTAQLTQTICFADLNVVQYEHSILFDNVTVFNDILYVPELGNRQYRLKLIGSKTGSWTGAFNPPGFVYNNTQIDQWQPGKDYLLGSIVQYKGQYYTALVNVVAAADFVQNKQWRLINHSDIKTGLLPNFAYMAQRLSQVYDVDNLPADTTFEGYGTSLIGFRNRSYLSNFGLDETSQVKFYQGFIKEKGTLNAITGLTTAKVGDLTSEIDVFEEWALRVGEYGALNSDQIIELELDQQKITANPTAIEFLNDGDNNSPAGVVGYHPVDLYRAPANYDKRIFFNRTNVANTLNDVETAGYVNLTDVKDTLFSFDTYSDLNNVLNSIGPGYYIWVARDFNSKWNVYRVAETQNNVTNLSYNIDGLMQVTFLNNPLLATGDVFAIKGFSSDFDGFYQVHTVTGVHTIEVIPTMNVALLRSTKSVNGNGVFYRLQQARLSDLTAADSIIPLNGWLPGDRLWVDQVDADGNWGVYEKVTAWADSLKVTDSSTASNGNFGQVIATNRIGDNIFVGLPNFDNPTDTSFGVVKTFNRLTGAINQTFDLLPRANTASGYGSSITASDYRVIVSAQTSNSNQGYAYVHSLDLGTTQILRSPTITSNEYFGTGAAISRDNTRLYIGAPGSNKIYIYYFDNSYAEHRDSIKYNIYTAPSNIVTLGYTPVAGDASLLQISDPDKIYVANVDYTLTGNAITFINPPVTANTTMAINQVAAYRYTNSYISATDTANGDRFGAVMALSDDGRDLFVSAPNQSSGTGAVYVYRAFEEKFSSIIDNEYVSTRTLTAFLKVYVDNVLQDPTSYYYSASNKLKFYNSLGLGHTVNLTHTGAPTLVNKLVDPAGGTNNQFGTDIAIDQATGTTLYVASPNCLVKPGQYGSVYRYTDKARQLGVVTATGTPAYVQNKIYTTNTGFSANVGLYINNYFVDLSPALVSNYVSNDLRTTANDLIPGNKYKIVSANNTDFTVVGSASNTVGTVFTANITPQSVSGAGTVDPVLPNFMAPADIVAIINAAQIPMITATTIDNGYLTISTADITVNSQMTVRPNGSNLFSYIGLELFDLDQAIYHPEGSDGVGFASAVQYNPDTKTLLVASDYDTVSHFTTIDFGATTFDGVSTKFVDIVYNAGAVYLYDQLSNAETNISNTGLMSYVQQLISPRPGASDLFGISAAITKDVILVGAPNDDSVATNGGAVYSYTNSTLTPSWVLTKKESAKVETANINRIFLYSKTTQAILASLDYIDPAKGKILGIAEQDIDFKTSIDPAVYNSGNEPGVVFDNSFHWNNKNVGKIWWNLNNLRYIDYEQDTLVYRANNWGSLFPGSQVQVAEWVESKYPPSQYASNGGDGTPLYADAYVTRAEVIGGVVTSLYYFWVVDKHNAAKGKKNSTLILKDMIASPQLQGIPYAFLARDNAVGLVNVQNYLSGTDTVLHIDYQEIPNSNSIHSEFQLLNQNDPTSKIPDRIINKMIDSLSGIDAIGQVIPDPRLTDAENIGINIRPRQTMVKDRVGALKNVVEFANSVLVKHPVVYQYSLKGISAQDPIPDATHYNKIVTNDEELAYLDPADFPPGYKVLVLADNQNSGLWSLWTIFEDQRSADGTLSFQNYRTQYFKTSLYWEFVNWYDASYDPTSIINFTVNTFPEVSTLAIKAGNIVKVNYDENGQFAIYRVNTDLSLSKVGIQNGTIQLLPTLYDLAFGQMSFDTDRFDTSRFDQTPSVETRNILLALRDEIFIKDLEVEFNKMFFLIVNYILQEQVNVDWIFKTSFISIFHKLRELTQPPSYVLDNQDYYLQYIDEVKPYRTIVREYVVDYTGNDAVESNVSDFDIPSIYNKSIQAFRPASGELGTDTALINNTPEYQYWKKYHTYQIDSVVVSSSGTGYVLPPIVTIQGGGGTGATAVASLNSNGGIGSITVTNPGSGYTSTPRIVINGTGTGGRASARLVNLTTRQFDSVLKFDRNSYTSNVNVWNNVESFSIGDIVAYNGQPYVSLTNTTPSDTFDYGIYQLLTGDQLANANDRIIAYIASAPAPNLDVTTPIGAEVSSIINNQFWLEQYITGIVYPGVQVKGLPFDANVSDQQSVDSLIQSRYGDTALGTRPEDINIDGGAYIDYFSSHAPEELLPGIVYDTLNMSIYTAEVDYGNPARPVVSGGAVYGYRQFNDIHQNHEYYRVNGFQTSVLLKDLTPTDTYIQLLDSTGLPQPDLLHSVPGSVFIGGEKITYWENNTATGQLRNIRRGVGGTSNQYHFVNETVQTLYANGSGNQFIISVTIPTSRIQVAVNNSVLVGGVTFAGNVMTLPITPKLGDVISLLDSTASTKVYDTDRAQSLKYTNSNTFVISSNVAYGPSSVTYNVAKNPTYMITLTGNITANVGDILTQTYGNANLVVRGNVTSSKTVAVAINSGVVTTANANCVVKVNGISSLTSPTAFGILGSVDTAGNVTITAPVVAGITSNVTVYQDQSSWLFNISSLNTNDVGPGLQGTALDPAYAGTSQQEVALFITGGFNAAQIAALDLYFVSEDSVNILLLEDGTTLVKE